MLIQSVKMLNTQKSFYLYYAVPFTEQNVNTVSKNAKHTEIILPLLRSTIHRANDHQVKHIFNLSMAMRCRVKTLHFSYKNNRE
jgi:hypothetical protein